MNQLRRPNMGNQFLNDVEQAIWEPSDDPDLISLSRHSRDKDFFTKLIYGVLLDSHHGLWGNGAKVSPERRRREGLQSSGVPHLDKGIKKYEESRMVALSNTISATPSSLLPTMVILVLYFANRLLVRIGFVIVFTAALSLALSTFTDAKKIENFSATTAYVLLSNASFNSLADQSDSFAAVEVVFVGSTSNESHWLRTFMDATLQQISIVPFVRVRWTGLVCSIQISERTREDLLLDA